MQSRRGAGKREEKVEFKVTSFYLFEIIHYIKQSKRVQPTNQPKTVAMCYLVSTFHEMKSVKRARSGWRCALECSRCCRLG